MTLGVEGAGGRASFSPSGGGDQPAAPRGNHRYAGRSTELALGAPGMAAGRR